MFKRLEYRKFTLHVSTQWQEWGVGVLTRFMSLYPYTVWIHLGPLVICASYEHDDALPF